MKKEDGAWCECRTGNSLNADLIAGIAFGMFDILPYFSRTYQTKTLRMSGLRVGLLLSLSDAIIIGSYGPILGSGIAGGTIIGFIVNRREP